MTKRWPTLLRSIPWDTVPYFVVTVVGVLLAIGGESWTPYDPTATELVDRFAEPTLGSSDPLQHVMGTDALGRDVFSRLVAGSQATFAVGFAGVLIGGTLGSLVGMIAGYRTGWFDSASMAIADVQLALPSVLLAIAVVAIFGPSLLNLIIVVGITGWVTYARVGRGIVLRLRHEDFVLAVRAIGGTDARIMRRHILPHYVPMVIVLATIELPRLMVLESTLSFLGLGVQPPKPSWGGMIGEGRASLETAWWITVFPGLALLLVTFSISRIGDWLRVRFDPTLRR